MVSKSGPASPGGEQATRARGGGTAATTSGARPVGAESRGFSQGESRQFTGVGVSAADDGMVFAAQMFGRAAIRQKSLTERFRGG